MPMSGDGRRSPITAERFGSAVPPSVTFLVSVSDAAAAAVVAAAD